MTSVTPATGQQTPPPARTRRRRRGSAEVRSAMLEAAQEVFSERGYGLASTRDIAARADVVEALIFRHFGSKADLFDVAVFEPIRLRIEEYWEQWAEVDLGAYSPEEMGRSWVGGMYAVLEGHRRLILAYLFAQAYEPDFQDEARRERSPLLFLFERNETMMKEALSRQGSDVRADVLAEFTFGLVFSATMLETLLPSSRRHTREDVVPALTEFVMRAVGPVDAQPSTTAE